MTDPEVDQPNSSLSQDQIRGVVAKEVILALGIVILILGAMWISTGSFPPMVVVESPVIHRSLLKVVANSTLAGSETWDVSGTNITNVESISMTLDYNCRFHGNLTIINWIHTHEGYLTTGDNPITNGCKIDQLAATGQDPRNGLKDEFGNPVTAVKEEWVLGIASSEIPWVGSIKLLASGNHHSVTESSWLNLTFSVILLLAIPGIIEGIPKISNPEEE